jgi:hypothetical protein
LKFHDTFLSMKLGPAAAAFAILREERI